MSLDDFLAGLGGGVLVTAPFAASMSQVWVQVGLSVILICSAMIHAYGFRGFGPSKSNNRGGAE